MDRRPLLAVAALSILAMGSPIAASTSGPMTACPFYVEAIGANGNPAIEGIVVASNRADPALVRIVLYTHLRSYVLRVKIPGFVEQYNLLGTNHGVTTRFPKDGHFSMPIFFAAPLAGPIEAAYAEPFDALAGSASCSSQRYFVSDETTDIGTDEPKRLSDARVDSRDVVALTFRKPETAPDCAEPYRASRVLHPVEPEFPADTRAVGVSIISVLLDQDGSVVDAAVFQTSGNQSLDRASLGAAASSTYSGTIFRCRPAKGTYLFRSEFDAL